MDIFEIGEKVREERRRRKLTQAALAELAGVSRVRINHIERGTATDVRFGTVLNVLNALNLDLAMTPYNAGRPAFDALLSESEEPESESDDTPSPNF